MMSEIYFKVGFICFWMLSLLFLSAASIFVVNRIFRASREAHSIAYFHAHKEQIMRIIKDEMEDGA